MRGASPGGGEAAAVEELDVEAMRPLLGTSEPFGALVSPPRLLLPLPRRALSSALSFVERAAAAAAAAASEPESKFARSDL